MNPGKPVAPRVTELTIVLVSAIVSVVMQAIAFAPIRDYRAGIMSAQLTAALLLDAYVIVRVIVAMFRGATWRRWKLAALMCLTSAFWIHLIAMVIVAVAGLIQYGQRIVWLPILVLLSGLLLCVAVMVAVLNLAEKRIRR